MVLGIISNLEMIENVQEDMHDSYANTTPYYIRDLSIHRFWYPRGILEPMPPWRLRDNFRTSSYPKDIPSQPTSLHPDAPTQAAPVSSGTPQALLPPPPPYFCCRVLLKILLCTPSPLGIKPKLPIKTLPRLAPPDGPSLESSGHALPPSGHIDICLIPTPRPLHMQHPSSETPSPVPASVTEFSIPECQPSSKSLPQLPAQLKSPDKALMELILFFPIAPFKLRHLFLYVFCGLPRWP